MKGIISPCETDVHWARKVADFAKQHGDDVALQEIECAIDAYSNRRKIMVAVAGLNKRGKSTFCNALLGRKDDVLAPVDWEPATGVISSFGNSDNKECAIVHFEDGHTQEINYEQIRDYVLEKQNPGNAKMVERVENLGHFDLDDDIILLDLPGDDSIHAYHSQIVYEYLPKADVVLFLSSASSPITAPELMLLSRVAENDRKKIFFIVNMADECDEEELEEAKEHNLGVLRNAEVHYENKLFCISAKQMMESGEDSFEFRELMDSIRTFLTENKLELQRNGFRNIVSNAVAGLFGKLETYSESRNLSETELEEKINALKDDHAHVEEMLKSGLDDFSRSWEAMVSALEQQLPVLEDETKTRVREYISNIPMLSFGKKTMEELPAKIMEIMELVLETPMASFKAEVDANLEKLDQKAKAVDKYLSDNVFCVRHTSGINHHAGNVIAGGAFIGIGSALMSAATIPVGWAGVPFVGWLFAGVGGILTAPLALLAAPLLFSGTLSLALPIFGWIRGKKRQKEEVIQSAENSITNAFCAMRTTKLPMLRQQGNMLVIKLRDSFTKQKEQILLGLKQALNEKTHLLTSGDIENSISDLQKLEELMKEQMD